jgi:hypothetical protein
MRKQRLLALARALMRDAKRPRMTVPFDLAVWVSPKNSTWDKLDHQDGQEHVVIDRKCVYAACAAGTACLMPRFQKEGLNFNLSPGMNYVVPAYGKSTGVAALMQFFDITREQAETLFMPDAYYYTSGKRAAREVACRIAMFAKTGMMTEDKRLQDARAEQNRRVDQLLRLTSRTNPSG